LAKPDRGEILLGGVGLQQASIELRRYVGLVSHMPLLYEHLTAWENLIFFAGMYDLDEPAGRIEAVLQAVDLWPRRNDRVRTYSRGMQQRLAIARAILHDPPVLLLDEPDTGLDQKSSQMLQTLLQHLGDKRRAILFSTHNLDRALTWADSVAMLVQGQINHHTATSLFDDAAMIHQLHVATGVEP
jgi:heme exporter protein A